jgi:choline-sulfatase
VPLIFWAPGRLSPRRVRQPVTLADLLPTLHDLATDARGALARPVDGRSLHGLLHGAAEDPSATAWGEYLAEGALAPMYMIRRDRWKFLHTPCDPDQLFDVEGDPGELENLALTSAHKPLALSLLGEVTAKFDIARIHREVLQSQQARHMLFRALKRGHRFPWDFQPLRDASKQYTRNHMSVTGRDVASRFPKAPGIDEKKTKL